MSKETEKKSVQSPGYIVYKDFEYLGKRYKSGEKFVPPQIWEHDLEYDEFRKVQTLKQRNVQGVAFMIPGEILDKKTGERQYRRAILPLKEA